MNMVSVAILKEKLSYYLKLVKEGQEIVVTSHRHQVARILPASVPVSEITEPARPVKDLLKLKGIKPRRSRSAVKALLEDRRRR
jgi:prevent-host-death family protein